MPAATGFQIAFLFLALQFFAMLATRSLAPLIGWPAQHYETLGQLTTLSLAAVILFGAPGLRRHCLSALEVPIPAGAWRDVTAILAAKLAIPFASVGAIAAQAFATQSAQLLAERVIALDPAIAWEVTLSPHGLLRMLFLSWFLGPVVEEIVFRGLLFRAFERQWGWLSSMVVTSILFGLIHPSRMVASAMGSVLLVCLLRRTGSLRACIVVHAAYNVLVSWPLLGQVLLGAPSGPPENLSTWSLPLACLAVSLVAVPACVWLARAGSIPAHADKALRA